MIMIRKYYLIKNDGAQVIKTRSGRTFINLLTKDKHLLDNVFAIIPDFLMKQGKEKLKHTKSVLRKIENDKYKKRGIDV